MTRLNCILCISTALMPYVTLVAAESDSRTKAAATQPSNSAAPQPELLGEYALIATQAELTDAQKSQLATIAKEGRDAEAHMRAANQERLDRLQKNLAEARRTGDKDSLSSTLQEIMRINSAASKAKKAYEARVLGLLTPEQKTKWAGFVLYREVCRTLPKANLTDDQKVTVRELCDDASLELGDDALKKFGKTVAARRKLRDRIKTEILTDQQRKAMGVRPAGPARPVKKPVKKPSAKRT